MIGIMIVAHGDLGESLIRSATYIMNELPKHCVALNVQGHDDISKLLPRLRHCIDALNEGDGVMILTDMFGGTPSNTIQQFVSQGEVEALSGVNLPMLIRTLTYRDQPLSVAVEKAMSGGQEGIVQINANND